MLPPSRACQVASVGWWQGDSCFSTDSWSGTGVPGEEQKSASSTHGLAAAPGRSFLRSWLTQDALLSVSGSRDSVPEPLISRLPRSFLNMGHAWGGSFPVSP